MGSQMSVCLWGAFDWQNNLIGEFTTKEKAQAFLDKCDMSGYVKFLGEK